MFFERYPYLLWFLCLSAGMRVIGVTTMLPEDELQQHTPDLMRSAITYVSVAELINL
jgi:hypothetical protein